MMMFHKPLVFYKLQEECLFIAGETGRMYEANVDDVGYRLVAVYTPVREDGVEGHPSSVSTEPIGVGKFKYFIFFLFVNIPFYHYFP